MSRFVRLLFSQVLMLLLGLLGACGLRTASFQPLPPKASATQFVDEIMINHAQIQYYAVTGSMAGELRRSMNELRPKDPYDHDRPVDAYPD